MLYKLWNNSTDLTQFKEIVIRISGDEPLTAESSLQRLTWLPKGELLYRDKKAYLFFTHIIKIKSTHINNTAFVCLSINVDVTLRNVFGLREYVPTDSTAGFHCRGGA